MLCVFLVHASGFAPAILPAGDVTNRALQSVTAVIRGFGPELFLVLSGFLMCRSLGALPSWGGFVGARVRRLYPTYLATLCLYVVLSLVFTEYSKLDADLWRAAVTVAGNVLLLPTLGAVQPLIVVSWTLSVLFVLYMAFPLAYRAFTRVPPERRAVLWAAGAAAVVLRADGSTLLWGTAAVLAGAAAWDGSPELERLRRYAPLALAAVVATLLARNAVPEGPLHGPWRWCVLAAAGLLLAGLRQGLWPGPAKLLAAPPMKACSTISYPFYLLHGLTIHFFVKVLIPAVPALAVALPGPAMLLAWLAAAGAAAWALHYAVESRQRPSRRSPVCEPLGLTPARQYAVAAAPE